MHRGPAHNQQGLQVYEHPGLHAAKLCVLAPRAMHDIALRVLHRELQIAPRPATFLRRHLQIALNAPITNKETVAVLKTVASNRWQPGSQGQGAWATTSNGMWRLKTSTRHFRDVRRAFNWRLKSICEPTQDAALFDQLALRRDEYHKEALGFFLHDAMSRIDLHKCRQKDARGGGRGDRCDQGGRGNSEGDRGEENEENQDGANTSGHWGGGGGGGGGVGIGTGQHMGGQHFSGTGGGCVSGGAAAQGTYHPSPQQRAQFKWYATHTHSTQHTHSIHRTTQHSTNSPTRP
jgi:hypothetical protein